MLNGKRQSGLNIADKGKQCQMKKRPLIDNAKTVNENKGHQDRT
jgi:hypothetical protein